MEQTRTERAREEEMTYTVVADNDHLMTGDNGNPYILEVDGAEADWCSCPDYQQRRVRCKHMAAYEEWLVDEVKMSHAENVEL
jgi:hypothetical protein